jgi:hypothetical protein
MMILREKKISLRKTLFLFTTVSAFALSTMTGYGADDRLDQPGSKSRSLEDLNPRQKALIQAVKDGNLEEVQDLFTEEEDENIQEPTKNKSSLLQLAIEGKKPEHKDIFEFFLRVNCNASLQNRFGETSLHAAAAIGDKDMLDRLLEEDTARVNIQDKDGNTAFHLAIAKKKLDCVSSFMDIKDFDSTIRNKKGLTVGDLMDKQVQGAIGDVDRVKELKTKLLRVFNISVQGILQKEVPITPVVHELATSIIQQNKKFFLSYCWSRDYSTKVMVDDFEKFIKGLGITNYYRDVRQEEGMGMTLGTHIEDFMKNAKDSDAVVIFLNDAYLRSRNCMYEFLQVWNADTRKVAPHAFIIRHPDFHGLFGGPRAALPYVDHWRKEYQKLEDVKGAAAHDRTEFLAEMTLLTAMESNISSIIKELGVHIQVDYQDQRSKGFVDVLNRALGGGNFNAAAVADEAPPSPMSPHKAGAREEGKKSEDEHRQKLDREAVEARRAEEAEKRQELERELAEVRRAEGEEKLRTKELQEAEVKRREAEEARQKIENLKKQLAESRQKEDERVKQLEQEAAAAKKAEGAEKQRIKELQEAEAKRIEAERKQKLEQEAAAAAKRAEGADKQRLKEFQEAETRKREEEQRQQLAQKAAQARKAAEAEEKDPAEKGPEMPLVARGHEATYLRFLNGVLIYKPNKNDVGMVTLPIAKLANPLEGTFDLLQCGNAGRYLRIATGLRTDVKKDSKVEIWFTPRFLVESNLKASASHFQPIFGNWDARNAVGIFWSWSGYGLKNFDYLTTQTMDELGSENLYKKWRGSRRVPTVYDDHPWAEFHVSFVN